jgi:hypothetical protein
MGDSFIDLEQDSAAIQSQLLEQRLILEVTSRSSRFLEFVGDEKEAIHEFATLWQQCLIAQQEQGTFSGRMTETDADTTKRLAEELRRTSVYFRDDIPSIKSSLAAWAAGGHGGAQSLNYFPQAAGGGVPEAFLAAPSLVVKREEKIEPPAKGSTSSSGSDTTAANDSSSSSSSAAAASAAKWHAAAEITYKVNVPGISTSTGSGGDGSLKREREEEAVPEATASTASSSSSSSSSEEILYHHRPQDDLDDEYVRYLGFPFVGLSILHRQQREQPHSHRARVVQVQDLLVPGKSKKIAGTQIRIRYEKGVAVAGAADMGGSFECMVPWPSADLAHPDTTIEQYRATFGNNSNSNSNSNNLNNSNKRTRSSSSRRSDGDGNASPVQARASLAGLALGQDDDEDSEEAEDEDEDEDDIGDDMEEAEAAVAVATSAEDEGSTVGEEGLDVIFVRGYKDDYAQMFAKRWVRRHGAFTRAQLAFITKDDDGADNQGGAKDGDAAQVLTESEKCDLLSLVEAMELRRMDLALVAKRANEAEQFYENYGPVPELQIVTSTLSSASVLTAAAAGAASGTGTGTEAMIDVKEKEGGGHEYDYDYKDDDITASVVGTTRLLPFRLDRPFMKIRVEKAVLYPQPKAKSNGDGGQLQTGYHETMIVQLHPGKHFGTDDANVATTASKVATN